MSMCLQAKFRTKITVIIDCFEIFIEQPINLTACHLIWSSYKQPNAIKYLIGITPQGTINLISEGWSGWASDQNSNFLSKLTHGDTVMADRGFNIGEMLGSVDARLKIHAFTKGKNHLHALEVGENQTTANVKIHVEWVFRSLQQKYSILEQTIPITLLVVSDNTTTLDKIVAVSCYLVNLCPSVMPLE